eukprot:scaffold368150_cov35-Attheya_sp.AAC.1
MSAIGFHNTDNFFEDHITNLLNETDEDETEQTKHGIQTTMGEERENEPYGDSHLQKDPEHDRWYIQNVNGINTEYTTGWNGEHR